MTSEASRVADDTVYPFAWIDVTMTSGPEPREYTVTLTVTDTIGKTATVSKLVTVVRWSLQRTEPKAGERPAYETHSADSIPFI